MVPWTSYRVADDHSLSERTTVVRADGADREILAAESDEQHGLALGVPKQPLTISDCIGTHAGGEIGAGELRVAISHGTRAWRVEGFTRGAPTIRRRIGASTSRGASSTYQPDIGLQRSEDLCLQSRILRWTLSAIPPAVSSVLPYLSPAISDGQ